MANRLGTPLFGFAMSDFNQRWGLYWTWNGTRHSFVMRVPHWYRLFRNWRWNRKHGRA